jgi:1-acyl-sn-glycerol-3-phosphate acyltransferase
VPVVPVTINGSMAVNPRNRIELYPGTIRIVFGAPIATTGSRRGDEDLLMEQVRTAIAANLEI